MTKSPWACPFSKMNASLPAPPVSMSEPPPPLMTLLPLLPEIALLWSFP